MADFNPVKKVMIGDQEYVPVKKASTPKIEIEPEVPEWGRENPNLYGIYGAGKAIQEQAVDPALKGTGLALGGIYGGIPCAAMGYAGGKKVSEMMGRGLDIIGGEAVADQTISGELIKSGKDVIEGAQAEMGGRAIVPAINVGAKIGAQALGRLTGTGSTAIKEAFKSGAAKTATMFEKALRGKMSAEDVVTTARNALTKIKDVRQSQYQGAFANLPSSQQIDIKPIAKKLSDLMDQYNVKMITDPEGKITFDTSRIAMGKKGIRDIKEIINKINKWGADAEDFTAKGLDVLKRQLDDFYSDSSQARAFVTSLRNTVKDTIVKAVPEYEKMTSKYAEATNLIKDIEANLMMRKQGMSGRIVADQTLRRLMSAMKDNFELRKELVSELSNQGNRDVMGAVAGHVMSSWMPRGLAGTGPAIIGNVALAKFVNPAFWPVVAMSSPRISGEFVRMLGKYSTGLLGSAETVGRVAIINAVKNDESNRPKYGRLKEK